jgi:hypothetical protein
MTDPIPSIFPIYPQPVTHLFRPTESEDVILPSFSELPDPAMLRAPIQPARIYTVDFKAKTAVVSFSGSPEKVTRNLHELIVLNPGLLAKYLTEQN